MPKTLARSVEPSRRLLVTATTSRPRAQHCELRSSLGVRQQPVRSSRPDVCRRQAGPASSLINTEAVAFTAFTRINALLVVYQSMLSLGHSHIPVGRGPGDNRPRPEQLQPISLLDMVFSAAGMRLDAARRFEQSPDSDIKLAHELPSSAARLVGPLGPKAPCDASREQFAPLPSPGRHARCAVIY